MNRNYLPVLIVENDLDLAAAIAETLEMAGIASQVQPDGMQALQWLNKNQASVVLTDVQMPNLDGIGLLKNLRSRIPDLPVILLTAYSTISSAITASQLGAKDYLAKPFAAAELIEKILKFYRKEQERILVPIAESAVSKSALIIAKKIATHDVHVLLLGESGSGKKVFAKFIHANSNRAHGQFVTINCATIPENMLEAMLFGYEKGAFTGALTANAGKFEQAQGGTLLLDEISEMTLSLQAKLLRVLQEKEVRRLGAKKTIPLDVRVLATSNCDLQKEVMQGKFREDLYYRLNVFPIQLQPLRHRIEDIIPLAEFFIAHHSKQLKIGQRILSESAAKKLQAYSWPGNSRELEKVIVRALVLTTDEIILSEEIMFEENNMFFLNTSKPGNLQNQLQFEEWNMIQHILAQGMSKVATAKQLVISPRTLGYKLAKMREQGL